MNNTEKLSAYCAECRRMNVAILLPDVNQSMSLFAIEGNHIRYGLAALKGVGIALTDRIVCERNDNGPFAHVFDFMQRTLPFGMNKKALESLIAAGAFETLHPGEKSTLMASMDVLLAQEHATDQQPMLLRVEHAALKKVVPWSYYESLVQEYKAFGFYLTGHPLDAATVDYFNVYGAIKKDGADNQTMAMVGVVLDVTERISKTGKKFAMVRFSDPSGAYDMMIFSELLGVHRTALVQGSEWAIQANVRTSGDDVRLQAQDIQPLGDFFACRSVDVWVNQHSVHALKACMDKADPGSTSIMVKTIVTVKNASFVVHMGCVGSVYFTPEIRSTLMRFNTDHPMDTPWGTGQDTQ
jgi:DNA polymerase-3 subunit alpha